MRRLIMQHSLAQAGPHNRERVADKTAFRNREPSFRTNEENLFVLLVVGVLPPIAVRVLLYRPAVAFVEHPSLTIEPFGDTQA